jgi:hypothetical protein
MSREDIQEPEITKDKTGPGIAEINKTTTKTKQTKPKNLGRVWPKYQ